MGITKDNVSAFTINNVKELKVYQLAQKMAEEEAHSMLKDNHHIIDSRAVAYLKQLQKEKQVINKDLV